MAELCSAATFFVCVVSLVCFGRLYGVVGLHAYSVVVAVCANIQVLKVTQYFFYDSPVPLGTVVFSTMFAVDNIINEHYGISAAKRNVYIGFVSYLFFAILMLLTDWHPAVCSTGCVNLHKEIHALFSPSMAFFVASVTAYLVGQISDVYFFSFLKSKIRALWLRSGMAMLFGTFIDNCVFSVVAWKVFPNFDISWSDVFFTYIVGTSLFRFVIALCCIPLVELSGKFVIREK